MAKRFSDRLLIVKTNLNAATTLKMCQRQHLHYTQIHSNDLLLDILRHQTQSQIQTHFPMCIALVHIADATPHRCCLNRKADESKSIKCAGK